MSHCLKTICFLFLAALCMQAASQPPANTHPKVWEAFTAFKAFAKGIPVGGSYLQDIELLDANRVKFTYLRSTAVLSLDKVADGVISNYHGQQADRDLKYIEFYSLPGTRCWFTHHSFGDGTYDAASWSGLGMNTDQFYVLLGNLAEAWKEGNRKNYQTNISYAERLRIVSSEYFIDYIPKRTTVVMKAADKTNEYYKELKRYIGKELMASPLYVNGDLKTYRGRVYLPETQKDFSVSAIEIQPSGDVAAAREKESAQYAAKAKKRQYDFDNMKAFTTEYRPTIMALLKDSATYIGEQFFIIETPDTRQDAYPQSFTVSAKSELYFFIVVGEMDSVTFSYQGAVLPVNNSAQINRNTKHFLANKGIKQVNAAGTKRWAFQFASYHELHDKLPEIKLSISGSSSKTVNQYAYVYCFKSLMKE